MDSDLDLVPYPIKRLMGVCVVAQSSGGMVTVFRSRSDMYAEDCVRFTSSNRISDFV